MHTRFRYSIALLLAGSTLVFNACAPGDTSKEVRALNENRPVGGPFTAQLAFEYRQLANALSKHFFNFDSPDAFHFARKGTLAAAGENVMPEPLNDWKLQASTMEPLRIARGRLIQAFDNAGREIAPTEMAKAQVAFDCWLENQEDKWIRTDFNCRRLFDQNMQKVESKLYAMPQPAMPPMDLYTGIAPDPSAPMAPETAKYLIFFDFDQYMLSSDANIILDTVASEIQRQTLDGVTVVGHADRSGSESYNDKLSLRRADAVKAGLLSRGVPPALIRVNARGENEPMVETPDNIREPANRRAEITFQ